MSPPDGIDLPRDPVFEEPWQAQAFAIAVALNERGLFGWDEWATVLARHLASADPAAEGRDYYHHWLAALEEILCERDLVADLDNLASAWQRAAEATPHGEPILLENDPQSR